MQFSRLETGNASLASVFGLMAVLGIYVLSDHKKTDNMRMEVLGRSLDSISKQANESALARTKSLLQVDSSGIAAVKVTNNSFQAVGGSSYQVLDGKLLLKTPDPRSNSWTSVANTVNLTMLNSEVAVEKVELNAVGTATALIAVAKTAVTSGHLTKAHRTRVRFDLASLNPPISGSIASSGNPASGPVASNPVTSPAPSNPSGTSTGPILASNSPNASGGPCGGTPSPGNSAASSQTGSNNANSSAQGQNTAASAQTTANSAATCSQSQTGGNSATATTTATGANVNAKSTTTTTGNSATSINTVTAGGSR